jgi:hypothetical protein
MGSDKSRSVRYRAKVQGEDTLREPNSCVARSASASAARVQAASAHRARIASFTDRRGAIALGERMLDDSANSDDSKYSGVIDDLGHR